MGRFLVAGAAGYVGARLAAQLLQQGHTVRGLVRDPDREIVQRLAAQGMAVWEGDLTQPESLVGIARTMEVVYNLTSRSVLANGSLRQVFVEGNRNLIAACSRARTVRAYIFAGNTAPYGSHGDAWVNEDTPAAPSFPLGETMAEAEQVILQLVRAHQFPAMILRVGTIYGPGRDFVDMVRTGTATLIGDGRNFLTHIQIDDLLDVLQRLAHNGEPGALYNVCDDQPSRAADFYGAVRQRLGMLPPRTYSIEGALAAGMDLSVVGMAAQSARMSNERMRNDLGIALRYPSVHTWLDEQFGAASVAEDESSLAALEA